MKPHAVLTLQLSLQFKQDAQVVVSLDIGDGST
jgi:hypothetical protein